MDSRESTPAQSIIEVRAVTKQFGEERAVDNVSFQIEQGQIFGLIGPSGSGKTTAVRLLTGVYEPDEGEVLVFGGSPSDYSQETRERIGYMPQLFVLYRDLTVWENLNFAASIYGMGLRRGARLNELLEFVELGPHRGKRARDISGGMQRRLSLAATLLHKPELIFLDEPTAGIDPVLRRKFWDHFKQLQSEGQTLVVTTQYVGEAAYCDLVGVMVEGRLAMVETPEGLRRRAYGGEVVDMTLIDRVQHERHIQPIRDLPFVQDRDVTRRGDQQLRIIVDEASTAIPALLEWCKSQSIEIESIEEYLPPFDDVFVELVQKEPARA